MRVWKLLKEGPEAVKSRLETIVRDIKAIGEGIKAITGVWWVLK